MNNWLKEIKDFFESSFDFTIGYTRIEILCIASLSIASSQVEHFFSSWTLLIFVSVISLFGTYSQRYNFLKKFPKSLIDSVEQSLNLKDVEIQRKDAEIERIKLEKSKGRSGLIHDAISKTIERLNDQTCSLSEIEQIEEITNKLCDKDVEEGLTQILTPLITEIYTIIEAEDSQILIGVFFNSISQEREGNKTLESAIPYYTTVKNDIGLKDKIPNTFVNDESISGDLLTIKQVCETCLKNNRFVIEDKVLFQESYKVAVSPIPYVCGEDEVNGFTLFLLKNSDFPKDFEKIVKVFNRLLANWMYKYNSCIKSRESDLTSHFTDDAGNQIQLFLNGRYKLIPPKRIERGD